MREWFYPREYAVIFSAIPDFLKLLDMSGPKDPLCSLPNFDNSNLLIEQFFSCVVVYFFFFQIIITKIDQFLIELRSLYLPVSFFGIINSVTLDEKNLGLFDKNFFCPKKLFKFLFKLFKMVTQ